MKPSVYYLYSTSNDLLYVGFASKSAFTRALVHQSKSWGDEIARLDMQFFDSIMDAYAHEDAEIKRLQPKYNVNQRDVMPKSMPSIKDVTFHQFNSISEIWCGGSGTINLGFCGGSGIACLSK